MVSKEGTSILGLYPVPASVLIHETLARHRNTDYIVRVYTRSPIDIEAWYLSGVRPALPTPQDPRKYAAATGSKEHGCA